MSVLPLSVLERWRRDVITPTSHLVRVQDGEVVAQPLLLYKKPSLTIQLYKLTTHTYTDVVAALYFSLTHSPTLSLSLCLSLAHSLCLSLHPFELYILVASSHKSDCVCKYALNVSLYAWVFVGLSVCE